MTPSRRSSGGTMETRKMQKVGGGTFTVSIPKEWAVEQGLEAGTTAHLYTHADGSILVRGSPKDGGELESTVVTLDGAGPERVERTLRAAHAVGFERVTLAPEAAFSASHREVVPRVARNLIGAEISDADDERVVVENLLDASEVSVRQSVIQLAFSALSIHERATCAFVRSDGDALDPIGERHGEVERLAGMIERHFNRSLVSFEELDRLGASRAELFDYYTTAGQLEQVAALGVETVGLADALGDPFPATATAGFEGIADATRSLVDDAVTAVLDAPTVEGANDLLDRRCELGRELEDRRADLVDGDVRAAVPLSRAFDAVRRTLESGETIAAVALRAAIRSERR